MPKEIIRLNRAADDESGFYFGNLNDAPVVEESLQRLQEKFSKPVVVEHAPIDKNFPRDKVYGKPTEATLPKNSAAFVTA